MSTQNFMSYGDAETIFTDVQAKKFSTGNVSTIQSTLTASKAYNQNDPFIYNGQLYKADSAIAQGDTITIGTNASATTIEELINLHSSSGSGGHTILDSSGTAMVQRGKLQFVGATVTDDGTNDKTVVTVARELTQAEYDALSTAEKNNGTTYYITNAPSSYTGVPQSMIGDAWVLGHAYAVGDYCIDGNALYKCKTAHTSSASNRPPYASYWKATSVSDELTGDWKLLVSSTSETHYSYPSRYKEILFLPVINNVPVDASVFPKAYINTLSNSTETWAKLGSEPSTYIIVKMMSNKFRVHGAYYGGTSSSYALKVYYR